MVDEKPKYVVVSYYKPPKNELPIVNVYGPFETKSKGDSYAKKQIRKYKKQDEFYGDREDKKVTPYLKFFCRRYIDITELGMQ